MVETVKGERKKGAVVRELEDSRRPAKNQNYRGSIQLASRHVKYYCPPRFIHSIFKREERKALRRPPNIFHHWIIPPLRTRPSPVSRLSSARPSLLDHREDLRGQSSCDFCHPVLRVFILFEFRARKSERSEHSTECSFLRFVVDWLTGWFCIIKENTIENS